MTAVMQDCEHALFVPFSLEPEALVQLWVQRGEAQLGRFVERWACLGVLVVESLASFRAALGGVIQQQEGSHKSRILRDVLHSVGRGLPACEGQAGPGVARIDPMNWETSSLGRVFAARVCSRGRQVQRLIEPGLRAFDAMVVVDGYLAAGAQRQSLQALGGLLPGSSLRALECWCVHRAHFHKKTKEAPLTSETGEETWRHVAEQLVLGGAQRGLHLTIRVYAPRSFCSRTHDRLIVLGDAKKLGAQVNNRNQHVIAIGPGIRAFSEEDDQRQDTAARLDATCFGRLREHFERAPELPLTISRPLSAL